jgi:hypothetical protein
MPPNYLLEIIKSSKFELSERRNKLELQPSSSYQSLARIIMKNGQEGEILRNHLIFCEEVEREILVSRTCLQKSLFKRRSLFVCSKLKLQGS